MWLAKANSLFIHFFLLWHLVRTYSIYTYELTIIFTIAFTEIFFTYTLRVLILPIAKVLLEI